MRYLLIRIICLFSTFVNLSNVFAMHRDPILIYNQFPRVWSMDFRAMTAYLPHIAYHILLIWGLM